MTPDMSYDSLKGGITFKSDVGTLMYDYPGKPYAVRGIDTTGVGPVIPEYAQEISYTSFESVDSISENGIVARFLYNSDNERARMEVKQGGNTIIVRWYPSGSYIKETSGGETREYTFIGGNAYSAPVVAVTQNGSTTYYYLLRDYPGSITHVVDATNNSVVAEYSYDSWGRMRNPATWENYSPGSEPSPYIAGRGFTGHEHLPWFSLINMNGRVYDPLTGQFLSPDNYVQAPDFTQSFNRYGYCVNNPLFFYDPYGYTWFSKFGDWLGKTGKKIFTTVVAVGAGVVVAFIPGLDVVGIAFLGGMFSGATAGGLGAALNGGDVFSGAVTGGIFGAVSGLATLGTTSAIGYGLNSTFPDFNGGGLGFFHENKVLQGSLADKLGLPVEPLINGVSNLGLVSASSGGLVTSLSGMTFKCNHLPEIRIFPIDDPYISSEYGMRNGEMHYGIDFINSTYGTVYGKPIYSITDGKIVRLVTSPDGNRAGVRVGIQDPKGYRYNYFHLKENSNAHLRLNLTIKKGDIIGKVGNTGVSRGAHLHFEIWAPNGTKINPYDVYPDLHYIPHKK